MIGRVLCLGWCMLNGSATLASDTDSFQADAPKTQPDQVLIFTQPPERIEFTLVTEDGGHQPQPPGHRGTRSWLWWPGMGNDLSKIMNDPMANQANTFTQQTLTTKPQYLAWIQAVGQANVLWSAGSYAENQVLAAALLRDLPPTLDQAWYVDGLLQLAHMHYDLDDYQQVLQLLGQAKDQASWQQTQRWQAWWLTAESLLNMGQFHEAVPVFAQLVDSLEQSEPDLSWRLNEIQIRASQFIARSLYAHYIQKSALPDLSEMVMTLEQAIKTDDAVLISDVLYAQAINQVMRRNLNESIALLDLGIELLTEAGQTAGLHLFYHQKAVTWYMFNHLDDALLNYRQALGVVSQQEFPLYWAGLQVSMAKIYRQLGEYNTASRYANRAEQFYQNQALLNEQAITHQLQGRIAEGAGQAALAITYHQQALAYFSQNNRKLAIKSLLEIGRNQLVVGDQPEARIHLLSTWLRQLHFLDPLSIQTARGLPPVTDDVFETLTVVRQIAETNPLLEQLLSLGQHQDVVVASVMLSLYELTSATAILSALRTVTELENAVVDWPVELQLTVYALLIEEPQSKLSEKEVDDLAVRALELINRTREQFAGTDTALYWNEKAQGFIDTYVTHLLTRGDAKTAFELLEAQQLRGIGLSEQLGFEHQQYQHHKQQLDSYLAAVKASVINGRPSDIVSLDEQRELLNLELLQVGEAPKAMSQSPSVTDLSALQRRLTDQQLVLKYVINTKQSQLFFIARQQWLSQPLPEQAIIRDLSQTFLSAIQSRDPAWQEKASALSVALRLNASLLQGKSELIVLADDVLSSVPFAALSAMEAVDYRPLVMDRTITHSRSLQHYLQVQEQGTSTYQTATVVSNPVFLREVLRTNQSSSTTRQDGGLTDGLLSGFMKLPQTQREASLLMQHMSGLKVNWLNREAATINSILSEPSRNSDIIHLATHGYFADTSMDHVGLATSVTLVNGQVKGGFLSLREIFAHRFNTRLVVISGCETIQGQLFDGEGLVGLTHGLLKQGADAVMATIWAIPDRVTPDFMDHFYLRLLQQSNNPATALTQAQRHFLQQFNNGQYRHPYYWSGYVLNN
jgi:CHAT domain-containing protein